MSRGRQRIPLEQRFWSRVDKDDQTGCWRWTGAVNKDGYGRIGVGGYNCRVLRAHRVAWELAGHTLIDGLELDHICHNRDCVNPDHLRQVTHKQNLENRSGPNRNGAAGVRGVYWDKRGQRWRAQVSHHGKSYDAGSFRTRDEAAEAARRLRLELHTYNDLDRKD